MLVEYLYVDDKRLDSYVEQFRSPVNFDKFSQLKAGFSITGPSVEGTQTGYARPLTKHEKVEDFTRYIVDHEMIAAHNPNWDNKNSAFFDTSTRVANRVVLKQHNLAMWISLDQGNQYERNRWFFLLEDFRAYSGEPYFFSSSSTLRMLVNEVDGVSLQEFMFHLPTDQIESELGTVESRAKTSESNFAKNPLKYLSALGAQIAPPQKIRAIYRFRGSFAEIGSADAHAQVIIGYPIFVERVD